MQLAQLTKATILDQSTQQQIAVMYNPEQFTLEEGNNFAEVAIPGLPTPPLQYVRGKARVLGMELFFDTYEQAADVRQYSDQVVRLLDQDPQTLAPRSWCSRWACSPFSASWWRSTSGSRCSCATARRCEPPSP